MNTDLVLFKVGLICYSEFELGLSIVFSVVLYLFGHGYFPRLVLINAMADDGRFSAKKLAKRDVAICEKLLLGDLVYSRMFPDEYLEVDIMQF